MRKHRVERSFERCRFAPDLRQQQTALHRGQRRERETIWIRIRLQLATLVHRAKAGSNTVLPSGKTVQKIAPCVSGYLGKLDRQRAKGTPAFAVRLPLNLDQEVAPGTQRPHAVEPAKKFFLTREKGVGLMHYYRAYQCRLVLEIMIELRKTDAGGGSNVLCRRLCRPFLKNQPRGGGDDPIARCLPFWGE